MKKAQFVLTDLEDRALAACDDMYLEAASAREVLSSWYGREIPFRELRSIYARLVGLGLLRVYAQRNGRTMSIELKGHRTNAVSVRATSKGRQYLGWKRHVV
jgi:hypothetical protein